MTRPPDNLDVVVAGVTACWSLQMGPPIEPGGQCSWVAPATRADGEAVVVKIGWPHPEAEHEAEGLLHWAGDGAVRLLDSTEIGGTPALLLERCIPGTHLSAVAAPDEQDVVVAGLLRRLWRDPPSEHGFRPLAQMCRMWAADGASRLRQAAGDDPGMIGTGLDLFVQLGSDPVPGVVLFTDLHAENILASQREPWLAIDPKPYVGDPTYDALQHMLNVPRLHTDPIGLAERLAELLDLDADRLRRWLFARCAVEAIGDRELQAVMKQLAPTVT
jgi:streptomycin 6-kinase